MIFALGEPGTSVPGGGTSRSHGELPLYRENKRLQSALPGLKSGARRIAESNPPRMCSKSIRWKLP